MRKRARFWRRAAAFGLASGTMIQATGCPVTATDLAGLQTLAQPIIDVAVRQATVLLADSVFFFLDNFIVRLRG